jgi:hypothetical protein
MRFIYEIPDEDYEQFKADFLEANPVPSIAPGFRIKEPDAWIEECGLRFFEGTAEEGVRKRAGSQAVSAREAVVKTG